MAAPASFSLGKEERVTGRTLVETLFGGGGSRSMASFPLRVVYCLTQREAASVRILVSVPKRYFKRAVRRNRVKRQVKEAFRKNKHLIQERMKDMPDKCVALAFIWMDNQLRDSSEVERRVSSLLLRVTERI